MNNLWGKSKLSFILWTKVPEKMNNRFADSLYNASGRDDGCTSFIGNSVGNPLDFHPINTKVYKRTIGGNMALGETTDISLDQKDKFASNVFGNGNPLKWKICQNY